MNRPEWMIEASYEQFVKSALPNETPKDAYIRLSKGNSKLYEFLWKGWICPSTPVLANYNTDRGLPISCFGSHVNDSLSGIMSTATEIATMTKVGGGTSVNLSDLRAKGLPIKGNGTSNGVVGWCKLYDTVIDKVRQGNVRRGAVALYLDAYHGDLKDFLRIRRPEGDPRGQCLDTNIAVTINDNFMNNLIAGSQYEREVWQLILKERLEMGEPYLFFIDNANKGVEERLRVNATNLCSEIMLHSDADHSFVCCLSSLNLAKYDEWKHLSSGVVKEAITLLDDVMEEFIVKASNIPGMERAVRFAVKSRALGLGVLGWHTLCQKRGFPLGGRDAAKLNLEIFKAISKEAEDASIQLGIERGIPEWGTNKRNTHTLAIAPTFSNSVVSGFVSEGVNPIASNAYIHRSSKKSFVRYNDELLALNILSEDDWKIVENNKGSVQSLNIDPHIKEVFKTAKEINQLSLIYLAGIRQAYIDQGQSVNLYCTYDVPKNVYNQWHLEAWRQGLKSLYYVRSSAATSGDVVNYGVTCESCQG